MNIYSQTGLTAFAGDWHGYSGQAHRALHTAALKGVDTLFQLGDFGIWNDDTSFLNDLSRNAEKLGVTVYFIDGNHENFPRLYAYPSNKDGTRTIRPRVHHLPRGTHFTLNGLTGLAFGGAYSIDRSFRTLGTSWWAEETATPEEVQAALNGSTIDLLLTHDSPAPAPNHITDDPIRQASVARTFGADAIQAAHQHRHTLSPLLIEAQPLLLLHGHYHQYWTGQYTHPSGRMTQVYALDEGSASFNKHVKIFDLTLLKDELHDTGTTSN